MSMEYNSESFTTPVGILAFPDHYVGVGHKFAQNDTLAATVGTRKIVKAGTFYPANDETAIGVVMHDYDVTDGDKNGTIIVHGFIKSTALPVAPAAAAKAALPMIKFLGNDTDPDYTAFVTTP